MHQTSTINRRNFLKLPVLQVLLWYLAFLFKSRERNYSSRRYNEAIKLRLTLSLKNQARSHWWIQDLRWGREPINLFLRWLQRVGSFTRTGSDWTNEWLKKNLAGRFQAAVLPWELIIMICEKLVHLHVQCCWKLQATNGKFLLKNVMLIVAKFIISHQEKILLMVN